MVQILAGSTFKAWPWSVAKSRARHEGYALQLVKDGVKFTGADDNHWRAIEHLVQEHIAGMSDWVKLPQSQSGALVALDEHNNLIGAMVVDVASTDTEINTFIHHLVVEPSWRGRGVGVVLLGMVDQIIARHVPAEGRPVSYYGQCAPKDARFYQKAGYGVLQPQHQLIVMGTRIQLPNDSPHPCWFLRLDEDTLRKALATPN